MADTAQAPKAQDSPTARQIRVFLSSTFRDFMEERDLLVKQVFPSLRRRAQERGVEVVDVDLRWGVTQEESEQGKVIGICLAEIERCRPYFIGMLGERYGWTPGKTDYPDELFEREQLGWIRDHQGNASVTELEILHGVLNDKEMAGRAFFYFRDPAWSRAQSEPGFVCDTPEEEAKLAALKDRIRASGFPVAKDLPDPKAIADQIEADLWALIEEQYPDLDQADALEREARKHANYRQSRLGVYLGQEYVDQLEALVSGNEKKILITGESGSGKSALIANWMHQHELEHPGDVVFAHHLCCSNDASAIQPLLGRMLDTASKLLKEAELITEPIQVPSDWWELTAKVAETLQDLGRWSKATGHRWIWVLDGLDRLAEDDQQALPWLPLLIPEGVSVVISALDCPARAILLERQFQLLEIGPLKRSEQEQLIDTYLERYTKKLDADRVEQILACDLARSPLFLRVLLEELRQCGRFETLEAQIADYIKPNADGSLAVNDIYARVLARLESDCGAEPVQKALTALWASRAGLSEPELLEFTGLAPLQWAPIDLALAQAIGRNGNRLVFDHAYLKKAVEDRWKLSLPDNLESNHRSLYHFFASRDLADSRTAEEVVFQASKCLNDKRVIKELFAVRTLATLANSGETASLWDIWLECSDGDKRLDRLIAPEVRDFILALEAEDRKSELYAFCLGVAKLLYRGNCFGDLLMDVSDKLNILVAERDDSLLVRCAFLRDAAHVRRSCGLYQEAIRLYQEVVELAGSKSLGGEGCWIASVALEAIAWCYIDKRSFNQALEWIGKAIDALPWTPSYGKDARMVSLLRYQGQVVRWLGNDKEGIELQAHSLEKAKFLFGCNSINYLSSLNDYVVSIADCWSLDDLIPKARELEGLTSSQLSDNDSRAWRFNYNCYSIYLQKAYHESDRQAIFGLIPKIERVFELQAAFCGEHHEHTIQTLRTLAQAFAYLGKNSQAFRCLRRALSALSGRTAGLATHRIKCIMDMSYILISTGKHIKALNVLDLAFEDEVAALPVKEWLDYNQRKAEVLCSLGRLEEGLGFFQEAIEMADRAFGQDNSHAIDIVISCAEALSENGKLDESEDVLRRCLNGREESLGAEHPITLGIAYNLAELLSQKHMWSEAIPLRRRELAWCRQENGDTDPSTLTSINDLAIDLRKTGALEEAEALFRELLAARQQVLESSDFDIGRALGGLARTLEEAGKLEEAATFAQQALDHRLEHEGPDTWWTNRERLDLARVLHKLDRSAEALYLLEQLQESMAKLEEPDEDDQQLLDEAKELHRSIVSDGLRS